MLAALFAAVSANTTRLFSAWRGGALGRNALNGLYIVQDFDGLRLKLHLLHPSM